MARTNLTRSLVLTKADEQLIPPHVRALYAAGVIDKKELDTYIGKVADDTRIAYESNFQPGMLQPPAPKEETQPEQAPTNYGVLDTVSDVATGVGTGVVQGVTGLANLTAQAAGKYNELYGAALSAIGSPMGDVYSEIGRTYADTASRELGAFRESVQGRAGELKSDGLLESENALGQLMSSPEFEGMSLADQAKEILKFTGQNKRLIPYMASESVGSLASGGPLSRAAGIIRGSGLGSQLASRAVSGGILGGQELAGIQADVYNRVFQSTGDAEKARQAAATASTDPFVLAAASIDVLTGAEATSLLTGAQKTAQRSIRKPLTDVMKSMGKGAIVEPIGEALQEGAQQRAENIAFGKDEMASIGGAAALGALVGMPTGAGVAGVSQVQENIQGNRSVQDRANLGKSAFAQTQQVFQSGAINENDLITERQRLAAALQIDPELIADNKNIADLTVRRNQSDLRKITDSVANELVQPTGDAAFDAGQQSAINLSNSQTPAFEVPVEAPTSPFKPQSQEGQGGSSGSVLEAAPEAPVQSESTISPELKKAIETSPFLNRKLNLTEAQKERTRKVTEIAAQELYARGTDVTDRAVKTRAQELLADKEQDVGKIEARIADEVRLLDKRNGKGRVPLTNLVKKTEAAVAKDVEKRSADVAEAAKDLTKFLSQEDTDNLIKSGVVTLKPTIKDEKGANVQGETYRGKFDINVESIKYENKNGKPVARNPKARQALLEAVASHEGGHLRDFGTKGEKRVALLANLVGDKAIDKLNSVIESESKKQGGLGDIARNAIERANKQTDNPAREEIANYFTEELTRRGYEGRLGPVWKAMDEMIAGARDNFSKVTGKTLDIRLKDLGYIAKQELKQAAKRGVEQDTTDATKRKSVAYGITSQKAREEIAAGGGFVDPVYGRKAVEISDKSASVNPRNLVAGATVGEALNHKALYEYYPKIKNYNLNIDNTFKPGEASFNPYTNTVTVSGKTVNTLRNAQGALYKKAERELISSIIHETQHGIQASSVPYEKGTNKRSEVAKYEKRAILTQQIEVDKARRELRSDNAAWWMYMANAGEAQARAVQAVFQGEYDNYQDAIKAISEQFPTLIRDAKDRDAFIDWWNKQVKEGKFEDETGSRLRSISEEDSPKTKQSYTININGVNRPTVNANGQRIAETDEQIRNFWRWFGDSKVVDSDGKPLVVYHGTNADFSVFDAANGGSASGAKSATMGFFAASNPAVASSYADDYNYYAETKLGRAMQAVTGGWYEKFNEAILGAFGTSAIISGGNVMPLYLSIKNPKVVDFGGREYRERTYADVIDQAKRDGHDGVILRNTFDEGYVRGGSDMTDVYVTFDSTQIKSVNNQGTFDPNDSRILRSIADEETNPATKPSYTFTKPVVDMAKGLFGASRPAEARIAEEAENGYIRRKQEESLNIVNALKKAMRSQGLNQAQVDEEWNRMNLTQTESEKDEFGNVALALNDLRKLIDDLSWKIVDIYEQSGIPVSEKNLKVIKENIGGYISRSFDINFDRNYGKKLLKKAAVEGSVEERIVEDLEDWLQTNIVNSLNNLDSLSDAEIDSLYKKLIGETKDTLGKLNKRIKEKTEGVENTGFKDEQNALKKSAERLEGKRVALRTAKQQELENFRGFVSDESLTKTLRDDLLRIGKKSNLASYYAGAARNEGILKYKEMIPEIILKAWGERTGAVEGALTTIMRQSKLVASTQFQMDLLARSPDSFGEARTETLNAQLSKDKGKYGPLAGMYVAPEMKTYLESHAVIQEELDTLLYQLHTNAGQEALATKTFKALFKKWEQAGSLYKATTVLGNPVNYAYNIIALGQNAVSNALPARDLSYTDTNGEKQSTAQWMRQFLGDVAGGTISSKTGEVYRDAIEFDFLGAGLSGDLRDAFQKDVRQFMAQTSTANQAVDKVVSSLKTGRDVMFTLPELFGTIANFVNEQNYLRKLWTAEGREFTERELKLEAADRTKKTSMNRSRAFPVAKLLDRTQLTTFLTFFAETGRATVGGFLTGIGDMRHASDLRSQGKTEAADLAFKQGSMRVAGGLAMFGLTQAMLAGLAKTIGHKFGEEDDEKKEYLPEDQRANLPWLVVVGETKEGTKKVFDVSKLDTYSALSNPIVSLLRGEPANAASQVSDLAFVNPLLSMAYKQFVAGEVRNREDTAWVNELAVMTGLANVVDAKTLDALTNVAVGVTPPIVKRSLTEAISPTEDIGGQTARLLTYAGSYLMEVNPKTQYPGALNRVKTELDAARQELNRVMTKENISEEAARTYIRKYHNRLKEIVDKESPMIQGAVGAGVNKKVIKQLATGINKDVQESLFTGIYKPKEMSKSWLNLSELNKEATKPEEKVEIAKRYKRNKDLYEKLFKEMYNGGKQ